MTVGIVGKYVDLPDAYLSVVEALNHAGRTSRVNVDIRSGSRPTTSTDCSPSRTSRASTASSYPVDSGSGVSRARSPAIRYARENGIPFLGLCLGLQCAVIEYARNVLGLQKAHSSEFDPMSPDPVIDLMETQKDVEDKGGTMRLGLYPAKLREGTPRRSLYGEEVVYETPQHRWEVNNRYRPQLEEAGLDDVRNEP